MAKVIHGVCDRCNKTYKHIPAEDEGTERECMTYGSGAITIKGCDGVYSGGAMDVCPECMEQFLKFWKMEDGREWIPLTPEQIPSECVLACDKTGELLIGWIRMDGLSDTGFTTENATDLMYNTVAWMPLPEPYKEDAE